MRKELFYDPILILERLGQMATERRRMRHLRKTVGHHLTPGHCDSLELLELAQVHAPQVIYDIGANIGTWTLLAKVIYPNATIHAFEPLAEHVHEFYRATTGLKDVHLHELALGESTGSATIHRMSASDTSSLLPLAESGQRRYQLRETGTVSIPIASLDDLFSQGALPFPDLIKLDIQGFELQALRGGINALAHAKAVIVEVSFIEIYAGQCLFHDLVEFLATHGLHVSAIGHGVPAGRRLLQADMLFERPDAAIET